MGQAYTQELICSFFPFKPISSLSPPVRTISHSIQNSFLFLAEWIVSQVDRPENIRQRGTGAGGQGYYISFLDYPSQNQGQLLPDNLTFCGSVSHLEIGCFGKNAWLFFLIQLVLSSVEWVCQKKLLHGGRNGHFVVVVWVFLFVFRLLSFFFFPLSEYIQWAKGWLS